MLKSPQNKSRTRDFNNKVLDCKPKTQNTKRKKSNEPAKTPKNNEIQTALSKKPPLFRKASITISKEQGVRKVKQVKKKLFIQTLLHGPIGSDGEKSTKRIDNRAQSNLEHSLKSKLELSQKIFINKNSSPNTVDRIIKNSLKKGKRERMLKEKEIKQKKLGDEIKRMENHYNNNLIRKINQHKIKQKKVSSELSTGRARKEKVFKLVANKLKSAKYRSISSRRPAKEKKTLRSMRSSSVEKEYFACNSRPNKVEYDRVHFSNSRSHKESAHFPQSEEIEEIVEKKNFKVKVMRNISLIDTEELQDFLHDSENLEQSEESEVIEVKAPLISDRSDSLDDRVLLFKQNRAARIIQKAFIQYLESQQAVNRNNDSEQLQNMIKDQLSWREAQLLSLDYLREKELEDLQSLAEIFGQKSQLEELLIKTVNQRYEQFTKVFKENLENAEQAIIEKMDTLEVLGFSNLIKDRKDVVSKLIEGNSLNGTLSKQDLQEVIEEGRELNFNSISCQTEEDRMGNVKKLEKSKKESSLTTVSMLGEAGKENKEKGEKAENCFGEELKILKDVMEFKSISIEEIISMDESVLSPHSKEQGTGFEITDYEEHKHLKSPPIPRPSAPLQFLDSEESSPNPDFYNSLAKPFQSLPLLNLHNLQSSHFQFPATTDRHIETDSDFIKKFISSILIQLDLLDLESKLKKSLKKDPIQELQKIRTEEKMEPFPITSSLPPILNIPTIIENILEDTSDILISTQRLVTKADKIHKIMLLSATDEVLQRFRHYGIKGEPMIWSDRIRNLNTNIELEKIIRSVVEEVVDYSRFEIGKIPTEEMILSNGHLDEELLQDIREDTLGYAIKREIFEFDWIWVDYEFEETQVKIDLSELILVDLSQEIIELDL